jgi:hypothetical protein
MRIFRRILLAGLVAAALIGTISMFYAHGEMAIIAFDSCVGLLIWSIVYLKAEPLLTRIALTTILVCVFIWLGMFFTAQ